LTLLSKFCAFIDGLRIFSEASFQEGMIQLICKRTYCSLHAHTHGGRQIKAAVDALQSFQNPSKKDFDQALYTVAEIQENGDEVADQILHEMQKHGHEPSTISFLSALRIYCRNSDEARVQQILKMIPFQKRPLEIYHDILEFCIRNQTVDLGFFLFDEIRSSLQLSTDTSLQLRIIQSYAKLLSLPQLSDRRRIFDLFLYIQSLSISNEVGRKIIPEVLEICGAHEEFELAFRIWELWYEKIGGDAEACDKIMDLCSKCGRHENGIQIAERFHDLYDLDPTVGARYLQLLRQLQLYDECETFFRKLHSKSSPSRKAYLEMIATFHDSGHLKRAVQLYKESIQSGIIVHDKFQEYDIDLHGFRLSVAKVAVISALEDKKLLFSQTEEEFSVFTIVTGRGVHSEGGHAVLQPGIQKFLADNGIESEFLPTNNGIIRIHHESLRAFIYCRDQFEWICIE